MSTQEQFPLSTPKSWKPSKATDYPFCINSTGWGSCRSQQKRQEPPTPTAFPQDVKAAGKKAKQPTRIDIRDCKVGMVGRRSYEAKKAESLRLNIEAMIARYGLDRVVLCTLTFANDPKSMRVAQRRFDSINSNLLGELFEAHVTAVHRGTKRGRIHYHLIAVCKADVRSGFDFEAWQRLLAHVHLWGRHNAEYRQHSAAVFKSANPALKEIWKTFRDRAEGYGFGMVETYPIRSNAEAVSRYVSSYVRVAAENRQYRDKRMRTLRYSLAPGERVASASFSWLKGPGSTWRAVMSVREEFTGAMAYRSPSIGRSVTRTRRFQTRGPQRQPRKMCPFRNFASNHILAASHSLNLDEAQGAEPRKPAPPL